jgi:hypothetical protein
MHPQQTVTVPSKVLFIHLNPRRNSTRCKWLSNDLVRIADSNLHPNLGGLTRRRFFIETASVEGFRSFTLILGGLVPSLQH